MGELFVFLSSRPTIRRTLPRHFRAVAVLIFVTIFSLVGGANLLVAFEQSAETNTIDTPKVAVVQQATPTPPTPDPVTPQPTVPAATTTPAPSTPQPVVQTTVAQEDTISIAALGLSVPYVSVGLTPTNEIAVDSTRVGWWDGSARPGQNGAVFLDGHNPGVFSTLPSIAVGNDIVITTASGERYSYTVVYREIQLLADVNMKKALTPYGGAKQGLNLITCIGAYDPRTGTSPERLIVYAVRNN